MNLMKLNNPKNKILLISGISLVVVAAALCSFYYFGQPDKNMSKPSAALSKIGPVAEKTYVLFSMSKLSETNKLIALSEAKLKQLGLSKKEADRIALATSLNSYVKQVNESIGKLSYNDQLAARQKFLRIMSDNFFSYMNSTGDLANSELMSIAAIVKSNNSLLPDGNNLKTALNSTLANYQPEITTAGASLATKAQAIKYVPITSVNSDFIKSKIQLITGQPPKLNAINVIKNKGIISAINIYKTPNSKSPTYNTQVFFFRNTKSGLAFVNYDYFEGEADTNYYISHYPAIVSSFGVSYDDLYWLGNYSQYSPLDATGSIINFY